MSKKINFGLVQDKYTNLLLYDESTRCDGSPDWINIKDLTQLDLTLLSTSSIFETNHTYRFDNTKNAYIIPYGDFIPFDGTEYNNVRDINFTCNGYNYEVSCNQNMHNATAMVTYLNTNVTLTDMIFYNEAEKIFAKTLNGNGTDDYIQITDGTLLDNLCFNKGLIKGNDFNWQDPSVIQSEVVFTIEPQAIDLLDEIPEGYVDCSLYIKYEPIVGPSGFVTNTWCEFLYKQSEIYRAKIFEYIANNYTEFQLVEQRWQTDFEIFMQKSIYYDALFKSFLASLEVGNKTRGYFLLTELVNYQTLNIII